MKYDSFREFQSPKKDKASLPDISTDIATDQTPEESIEEACQKLHSQLSTDLLDKIKSCSPSFFEKLVIDLLITMGYGGSRREAGKAIGGSGDGGIDGVINEDKLGLDVIHIQAKRWNSTVPAKEIRDFVGALALKNAKKGIFITTSKFTKDVGKSIEAGCKIILIDGERLADLMIEHNVGLSTVNTYHVKAIDFDYFEEN